MEDTEVKPQKAIIKSGVPDTKELDALKERATLMGMKFHPSIGLETLKDKVAAKLAVKEEKPEPVQVSKPTPVAKPVPVLSKHEKIRRAATRLIRIRITCMNPNKREWPGEMISARNRYTGTVKKYIPFNAENGWHVPWIIYQRLKDKKCQVFVSKRDKLGNDIKTGKLVNEFSIEVLPPLTGKEREVLKAQQQASIGIDNG